MLTRRTLFEYLLSGLASLMPLKKNGAEASGSEKMSWTCGTHSGTTQHLWDIADCATTANMRIRHNNVLFVADSPFVAFGPHPSIAWFAENDWDIFTLPVYDEFEFWKKEKGCLYWCGRMQNSVWRIMDSFDTKPIPINVQSISKFGE